MEPETKSDRHCPNCEAVLVGRYCSKCGQEDFGHEPNLRELLADVWSNIFSVDGRLITTLKAMVMKPGQLTLDYFEGKRARYVTPFKLYLTCSAAYFLVARSTDVAVKIQQNGKLLRPGDLADPSSKVIIDIVQEGQAYFFSHLATILFIGVPLTALASGLLFLGKKRTLLYHLVFVLHVWSAVFLFGALISACRIPINFFQISLMGSFIYSALASRRAFQTSKIAAALKGFLLGFSSLLVSVIALVAIMIVIAMGKKTPGKSLFPDSKPGSSVVIQAGK